MIEDKILKPLFKTFIFYSNLDKSDIIFNVFK